MFIDSEYPADPNVRNHKMTLITELLRSFVDQLKIRNCCQATVINIIRNSVTLLPFTSFTEF